MKPIAVLLVLLFATLHLVGCKSLPGADSEYATHDRGSLNRGSP
jgi:hypothetical protein